MHKQSICHGRPYLPEIEIISKKGSPICRKRMTCKFYLVLRICISLSLHHCSLGSHLSDGRSQGEREQKDTESKEREEMEKLNKRDRKEGSKQTFAPQIRFTVKFAVGKIRESW